VKNPSLRVSSGKYRRAAIPAAKAFRNHQNSTTARVKEAAFQIIQNRINIESDWCFYDLFAGSGQMGIEALSLGASHATFVDIVPERLSEIQRALLQLEIPKESYTIARARANKILPEAFDQGGLPSVIWADPPYTYNHSPSNDPAILLTLYRAAALESKAAAPLLMIQVHEKNPILVQEYLTANPDIEVYRYGSNCLVVLEIGG
jgi:16S rRNA (guanine966-N2)-methyltransferase